MDIAFHIASSAMLSIAVTGRVLPEAIIFGVLPDIIGSTPFYVAAIKKSKNFKESSKKFLKETFHGYTDRLAYKITHSFSVTPLIIFLAALFFRESWYLGVMAYLLHLLVDIPTHNKHFSLELFFPISHFKFKFGKYWKKDNWAFYSSWSILGLLIVFQLIFFL